MISTTLEAALAVLAVEFALLGPLVAYFSLRGVRSVEAAATSEATELVTKVTDTEDSRRLALETVFRDKYKYGGEELTAAVDEFMQREKAFYNAVVGAVLGRGDSKISDIHDELTKVVAPWISITPKNMVDAESAEAVATEKARIEVELGATRETLEKMISEYNRAFRIELDDGTSNDAAAGDDVRIALDITPEPEPDAEKEIDYRTEELNDLDEVLEAIDAQKSDDEIPAGQSIVNPGEDDQDEDSEVEFALPDATVMVEESATVEEPDALDELDDDVRGETPDELAGKPMTADDLDELMESLDIEPADEVEPA